MSCCVRWIFQAFLNAASWSPEFCCQLGSSCYHSNAGQGFAKSHIICQNTTSGFQLGSLAFRSRDDMLETFASEGEQICLPGTWHWECMLTKDHVQYRILFVAIGNNVEAQARILSVSWNLVPPFGGWCTLISSSYRLNQMFRLLPLARSEFEQENIYIRQKFGLYPHVCLQHFQTPCACKRIEYDGDFILEVVSIRFGLRGELGCCASFLSVWKRTW